MKVGRTSSARNAMRTAGVRVVPPLVGRHRAARTTLLLVAVFVLNAFDLALTHSQIARGDFVEANAFAAGLADSAVGVAAYKSLLFAFGAYVLYRYRRRRLSEFGAWLLCGFYGGLMVWWHLYLNALEACQADPAVVVPMFGA